MYRSSLNPTVKTTLKSVDFDEVTEKNKLAPFLMAHGAYDYQHCEIDFEFLNFCCELVSG